MKDKLALAIIAATMSATAFAAGSTEGDTSASGDNAQSMGAASMQQLDTNQDGMISQEEAQANPDLLAKWKELDTNGDGQLDKDELAKAGDMGSNMDMSGSGSGSSQDGATDSGASQGGSDTGSTQGSSTE